MAAQLSRIKFMTIMALSVLTHQQEAGSYTDSKMKMGVLVSVLRAFPD
jgi:hypothetical protein